MIDTISAHAIDAGYDTIHFWYPEKPGNLSYVTNWSETSKADGSTYRTGHLDNYRVFVSDRGISLKGSLSRHFLGSNCETLTRSDTENAILSISDRLSLPMEKAKITRLDFGQNVLMEYPPDIYFPYLGRSNYLKRIVRPHGISYQNGKRQFYMYDKIAELKAKRMTLPDIMNGSNVIRLELRLTSRPDHLLKQQITGATLSDSNFLQSMKERYVSEYRAIEKIAAFQLNLAMMKTPGDFIEQMAAFGICKLGMEATMQLVDELKARKTFANCEEYSRLKKKLRQLSEMRGTTTTSPLIDELTAKVESVL